MWFGVITLFPELFQPFCERGVFGRAIEEELIDVQFWNPRNYAEGKHRAVDDRPYGGGPGMVLLAEPVQRAITAARSTATAVPHVVHLTPQGKPLDQGKVNALAEYRHIILLAGRYEGIDERVVELEVDEEISVGDYVLSGGELPAMVLMDAVSRMIPGVLGHADLHVEESFSEGLLDYPHYTRPEVFQGRQVPEILLSGHHAAIKRWRLKTSLGRTWERRSDLLARLTLTREQQILLDEYIAEHGCKK